MDCVTLSRLAGCLGVCVGFFLISAYSLKISRIILCSAGAESLPVRVGLLPRVTACRIVLSTPVRGGGGWGGRKQHNTEVITADDSIVEH